MNIIKNNFIMIYLYLSFLKLTFNKKSKLLVNDIHNVEHFPNKFGFMAI